MNPALAATTTTERNSPWRWLGVVLTVVGAGLLALAGFAPRFVAQSLPMAAVAPNSLLAMLLLGAAIVGGPTSIMRWLGAAVVALAAIALLQTALAEYPRDDNWRLIVNVANGDRMSFGAAVAFAALGCVCLICPLRDWRGSATFVLFLVGFAFALAMIGIATELMGTALWDEPTAIESRMNVVTAIGLLAASIGMAGVVAGSASLRRFIEEHPDRRILVRSITVGVMLVLAAGFLAAALVTRNAIDGLVGGLEALRDTNVLLFDVAIREAQRQARLIVKIAQDEDDGWIVEHLAETGTDSVLGIWQLLPGGGRRVLSGREASEPAVAIALEAEGGRSRLLWDERWIVEVRDGSFVAQVGVDGLEKLFKYSPAPGTTSDLVICAKHGDGILFFPTRLNRQPMVQADRYNADGRPYPASRALDGQTGVVHARDYRGREVFAAVAPVADGRLGIVQKIDTAEVLAPLRAEFLKALLLTLSLLGLGALLLHRYVHPLIVDLRLARSALARSHADLQRVTTHLEQVREEEQLRVARDIHDEMGSTLAAIDMQVHQMQTDAKPEISARSKELGFLKALSTAALASLRKVVHQLRPAGLDGQGLSTAIEVYAVEFERRSGVSCRCKLGGDTDKLTDAQITTLFRLAQESLNNVAKHAAASSVEIVMGIVDGAFVLHVQDDGQGFDPDSVSPGRFGLLGIRERARMIGATVDIVSAPGAGTCIAVSLPLEQAATGRASPHGRM